MSKDNFRPGVYSSYQVRSRYGTPRSKQPATIICRLSGYNNIVNKFSSYREAKERLEWHTANRIPLAYCQLLFETGVSHINLIGMSENIDSTIKLLESINEVGMIIGDITDKESCIKLLEWVNEKSQNQSETICFLAREVNSDALETAKAINHERCVVCFPAVEYQGERSAMFGACALAGKILVENRPNYNLNGLALDLVGNPDGVSEKSVQILLGGGVCVLEKVGNVTECIRGVNSRTNIGGVTDYSVRSINTVLIIDDVMRTVRNSLKNRLKGIGISSGSLDSIASQVLIELSVKEQEGIIERYELPRVYATKNDPTVCVVEIAFNVAHVISQINIMAHIGL